MQSSIAKPSKTSLRAVPSLALALASSAVFVPTHVFGQAADNTPVLAPVKVTGEREQGSYQTPVASQPKFTAPLLDTPKTVQVIPQAVIQDSAASSLEDVLRNVPGITFGAGEGGQPLADRPFIRGMSSGNNVYVDGIRDPGGQTREIFNLESVEVIKGADSAYGGRGSGGGSINLASKRARLGNSAEGSLGFGTDHYLRGTADGNWQFNETSAFRLSVLGAKGDVAGREAVDYKKKGIAPSLSFGLGTPTRVTLSYYHLETNGMPDYGVPLASKAPALGNGSGILDVSRDAFYGLYARDYQKTKADIGTVEIEHDLSDKLTFRNATRYGKTLNDYVVTNPGDGTVKLDPTTNTYWMKRGTKSRWQESTMLTNISELYGEFETGSLKHRFNAGVELSRETNENATYNVATLSGTTCPVTAGFGVGDRDCTPLLSPNPNDPWTGTITRNPLSQDLTSTTRSVYLLDTIDLSERFQLNTGVRVDNYRLSGDYTAGRPAVTGSADGEWTMFNYQAGLVYKPASNGSIYVSYATASTPPTISGGDQESLGADTSSLKPERSNTIELGTKWDVLDNKLSLTAAIFQNERKDAQINIDANTTAQAGKTRVRGLELGISGQITREWSVFGGYTYMDSELLKGSYDSVNEGDPLANTPKHSLSLWSTYAVTPDFTLGGGAYYVGKTFGGNQNGAGGGTNKVYMPAYWRFDAMASYQVNKHLNIQLNALNLTDKEYYIRTNGVHHADFGPGRQFILSANMRY
ncbi:TonB-dependent siderophore receptor [Pusillimonas sp. NJUB218]|uniref:TonB-dependent receptor n=1 Tax=Pusillimonas sp. NJUB218 TaxID=2023230 RepID=UPI000F4BE15E|nr:TonB-dependent siderophore receptor [Pusillimonas sp. NJUB218]ROT46687.1 TonB-dependent siderophore receptor [Pusillimonas sp. NJUB218]